MSRALLERVLSLNVENRTPLEVRDMIASWMADTLAPPAPCPLHVDPARKLFEGEEGTGIFIRAKLEDKWGAFDVLELDAASLLAWLRSDGGENRLAENTVGILLGHGHLHGRDGGAG